MKKSILKMLPFLLFLIFAIFPDTTITGAKEGLLLWYQTVVPTLLPFIIISNIILKTNSAKYFSILIYPLLRKNISINPNVPYVIFVGFICGFPMGAKVINDLYTNNQISQNEAQYLLGIVSNASPMFIIGYIGIGLLDKTIPTLILISLIYGPVISTLIIHILIKVIHKILFEKRVINTNHTITPEESSNNPLDTSITDALFVICKIGVYIMLFSIIVSITIKLFNINNTILLTFVSSLEITRGTHLIYDCGSNPEIKIALILALTSFGGFSSTAQIKSVISKSKLSLKSYYIWKTIFAICTYLLTILYIH